MYEVIRRIGLLLLCVLLLSSSSVPVSAYSFSTPPALSNRQKAHLNVSFTGGSDDPSSGSCVGDEESLSLSGGNNLEKIYGYFRGKGLSPDQAAGIIGNISVESGGDPENTQTGFTPDRTKDPLTVSLNGDGKQGGWGIIQWTPSAKLVQPNGGLMKVAGIESPVYQLISQLELVWWHMNNISPTGVKNMYEKFKTINDVSQATIVFEDLMEGADVPNIDERIRRAKEFLRDHGGGSSTTAPVAETAASICGSGNGGVASANGMTFPLITTKKAIKEGSSYGGDTLYWCYENSSNCHHDYNAADIHVPVGTVVIAAKPGVVQHTSTGNQHPNNITITTTDGQGINYYTHMGANTVKLRDGQPVKAGEKLGEVGTAIDAMNTAPHLHFDMMPAKYTYRPECSSKACSKYEFINVQPALIELYKLLPES